MTDAAIGRQFGGVRDETIDRVGLVGGPRHQRVEQKVEPLRRIALQDERVEAVERRARRRADHRQAPALRRVGIDPLEMLEVGRILELAEGRQPMPGSAACADTRARSRCRQ